jgi:hypothetical protein
LRDSGRAIDGVGVPTALLEGTRLVEDAVERAGREEISWRYTLRIRLLVNDAFSPAYAVCSPGTNAFTGEILAQY